MNFLESIRVALTALRTNVLRSILTMLGIIIGVAAVITMIAMGAGAQQQVDSQISSLGSNLLMIHTGSQRDRGVNIGNSARQRLTYGDAKAIKREISGVLASAAIVSGKKQVVFGNMNWATTAHGADNDNLVAGSWVISEGRSFRNAEVQIGSRVALLGHTVQEQLFGESNALGQTIRIGNVPFEVIGVLEEKGQSMGGQDQDDFVMVPLTTARSRLFGDMPGVASGVNMIMVSMEEDWMMSEAQIEIEQLLEQRHRIRPGEKEVFRVRNLAEMAETAAAAFQVFNMLLASIASVSLIVGGIGIMNIMLVSVTERTREIGLRRAVGASPGDILVQFLIEAVTLCIVGGALGVGLAITIVVVTAGFTGWPVVITPDIVALAVLFSGFIGIFFGWYPARKAARQNPIESLRYE